MTFAVQGGETRTTNDCSGRGIVVRVARLLNGPGWALGVKTEEFATGIEPNQDLCNILVAKHE